MNAQERALLDTIRDCPDEDGPRLVYADWLDEAGECARAEFIRIQCNRAALDAYHVSQPTLARRERRLVQDHAADWVGLAFALFAPYHPPPDEPPFDPLDPAATRELTPQPRWNFRRGFAWAEVSPSQFLTHADMLLDAAPLVQLHIGPDTYKEMMQRFREPTGLRPRRIVFEELLNAPKLAQGCVGLTLVEESDWDQYTQYGQMLRLSTLHGRGEGASRTHLRELAHVPGLSRLSELSLNWMNLGDLEIRELALSPWLKRLQTLDLRGNRFGPDGVATLMASLTETRLRELDLSDNQIGDQGVHHLARWPGLSGLRVLRLEGCSIGPYGAAALATSPYLRQVTQLSLQRNHIRGAGVAALLDPRGAEWLAGLARLDLCGNRIGSLGAQHLTTASAFLPNLRRLYLSQDRDDLADLPLRWLTEAYGGRLKLDWFEPPY